MALARREFQVTDQAGNIVTDAQVEVRLDVPGQPLALIFEDREGTTPRDNPFTVDSNGVAAFHAAGGAYRVRAFAGAFERIERYVAIGTAAETDAGALPVSGPPGWVFDSATADADPGNGEFRLNNASPSSATAAYIDNLAFGGVDLSAWLQAIDDGGDATSRGLLTIFDPNAPNTTFRIYSVSGTVVDGTGYRKLTIAHVTGAGSFTAGTQYQFTFSRTGPVGPQGPEGPEGPEGPQGPQGPPGSGGGSSVDRQVFNSGGTWTKPSSGTIAKIECWGAGGSGGRAGAGDAGGGGGGGSYVERWMPLADLGATETVTIGAGGASRTTDDTDGQGGGNTTFGAHVTAYGGGGGSGSGTANGGGGGGGAMGAGASAAGTATGGTGGAPTNVSTASSFGGGGGGTGATGGNGTAAAGVITSGFWGGGGGGGGSEAAPTGSLGQGAPSVWGGGGGGGGSSTTNASAGGASLYGGAGGAGGFDANNAVAGAQPAGGGGGSEQGNSGAGAAGRVIVTVW